MRYSYREYSSVSQYECKSNALSTSGCEKDGMHWPRRPGCFLQSLHRVFCVARVASCARIGQSKFSQSSSRGHWGTSMKNRTSPTVRRTWLRGCSERPTASPHKLSTTSGGRGDDVLAARVPRVPVPCWRAGGHLRTHACLSLSIWQRSAHMPGMLVHISALPCMPLAPCGCARVNGACHAIHEGMAACVGLSVTRSLSSIRRMAVYTSQGCRRSTQKST